METVLRHVAHLLPSQGPISTFVHHNTLHALEHLHFDDALRRSAEIYGCEPYLSEQDFRNELLRGRIEKRDLEAVLRDDLGPEADAPLLHFGTRFELRLAMLEHRIDWGSTPELRWLISETDALRKFSSHVSDGVKERVCAETRHWAMRDLALKQGSAHADDPDHAGRPPLSALFNHFDRSKMESWDDATWQAFSVQALWRICRAGVHRAGPPRGKRRAAPRHRDVLLVATGEDSDLLVHELLIRLCGAYVDQGMARWPLPEREDGLFRAVYRLYGQQPDPPDRWLRGFGDDLRRIVENNVSPLESILDSLAELGVAEEEWESYLTQSLLALRGWAGMLEQLAIRHEKLQRPVTQDVLAEYLALRLVVERRALSAIAAANLPEPARDLTKVRKILRTAETAPDSIEQRAFTLFQVAELLGWLPRELYALSQSQWKLLVDEVEAFGQLERRRLFQEAFEWHYRIETLDAFSVQARTNAPPATVRPKFQAVFCIDDREESFRRHLEEVVPEVETFAAAGFFGVAMYYRGAAHAHYEPLCPVVIEPKHWVVEDVAYSQQGRHRRRAQVRRALGTAIHRIHVGTRSFVGGAVSALLGSIASVPLVARVVFPRLTARLRRTFGHLLGPPTHTRLVIERTSGSPSMDVTGVGYSLAEMTDIVEHLLRDIGLMSNFARLVFIVGHGSSSLNNPLEPAYNCGACGGARGGPNARAFAQMANHPGVRRQLEARGIAIPRDALFIGAFHDTCSDAVTLFDIDQNGYSHKAELADAERALATVRQRNAHERCRRFDSAPLSISPEEALRHVERRAEDLAQVRPECGHATNAVCYIGRRSRCLGLYMDRRTFLVSYDPECDDPARTILRRVLGAALPVCAGISLEYYFSRVDTGGWGCGSKLPQNVTARLGVMDGAASDLRPGLPWQMVELHEPMRLLVIVEAVPATIMQLLEQDESFDRLARNAWIQLATLDPESNRLHLFDGRAFQPYTPSNDHLPRANSSESWYRGWRDHLGYAVIADRREQGV